MSTEFFLGLAGIIALGAAITTIWQAVLTRKHNRLSVKPLLRLDRNAIPGERYNITLMNNGFGPAIITSLIISIDDKAVAFESKVDAENALRKINLGQIKVFTIFPSESFPPNVVQPLFESKDEVKDINEAERILRAFDRISFEISYKSIYNEEFHLLDSRKVRAA
jgi:hypothetical protein